MSLAGFLTSLGDSSRHRVPLPVPLTDAERREVNDVLKEMDRAGRLAAPGVAPPLDAGVALWAGELLYRACQFLVFREVDAPVVETTLNVGCPKDPLVASTIWSADLALRHLPEVVLLAKGLSLADPLVQNLNALAARWPLSCLDTEVQEGPMLRAILGDKCLCWMYADRLIACGATKPLAHAGIAHVVRDRLGHYPQLAPKMVSVAVQEKENGKEV